MAKKPVPVPTQEQNEIVRKADFAKKVEEHKQSIADLVDEANYDLETSPGEHLLVHGAILHKRLVALEEKVFGKAFELPEAPEETTESTK